MLDLATTNLRGPRAVAARGFGDEGGTYGAAGASPENGGCFHRMHDEGKP